MNHDPCTPTPPTILRFGFQDGQRPFWEEGLGDIPRSDRFLSRAERERRAADWERKNVRTLRRPTRRPGDVRRKRQPIEESAQASETKTWGEGTPFDLDPYGFGVVWWAIGLLLFYRRPDLFSYWVLGTLGVGYFTRKTPQYLLFSAFFTGLVWYAAHKYNLI